MPRNVHVMTVHHEKGPDCNGCGSDQTTHIVRIGRHESWLCFGCAIKLGDELEEHA